MIWVTMIPIIKIRLKTKNTKKFYNPSYKKHKFLDDDGFKKTLTRFDDPILLYLSKAELLELSDTQKFQLALDRYKSVDKNNVEIGSMYERYVGKTYEEKGYNVTFEGIHKGLKDQGRDLIAKNQIETRIIQTKYWAEHKQITAEYIRKLYKTTELYKICNPKVKNIIPVFYTTANFSSAAIVNAEELNVELVYLKYDRNYPLIKCNINQKGEKIYHLPFDPYYDKVKIEFHKNEFYAQTILEAEYAGFRRAKVPGSKSWSQRSKNQKYK